VKATLGTPSNNNVSGINSLDININSGNGAATWTNYGYAGYMNWTVNAGGTDSALGPVNSTFKSFCIELNQHVNIGGQVTYTIAELKDAPLPGGGMGSVKADAISRLWNGAYSNNMTNVQAAAFQLAIWRLEYDWTGGNATNDLVNLLNFDGTGTGHGNFRTNGGDLNGQAAIDLAETLLTNVFTANGAYGIKATGLVALTSDDPNGRQDQITQTPEPTSMCLAVIGGLMFTAAGYRRLEKKRADGEKCNWTRS